MPWYKLQTSPVICPENHLNPHPRDAAWEGCLLGKVTWKILSLGKRLSGTGTNHASLICELVIVGLLIVDYGAIPKASGLVARHDYGQFVPLGLLYMSKQPPDADCLHLLGSPKSMNNARSEISKVCESRTIVHRSYLSCETIAAFLSMSAVPSLLSQLAHKMTYSVAPTSLDLSLV